MIDLGLKFNNPNLLKEAFTHRSFLNENPQVLHSNERLEFLGDSVLQVLASTVLFKKFPEAPEGKLTNLRSALVRTTTLARVAKNLGFGEFLLMSKGEEHGGGRNNPSLLADTFEAVLGAIYLDAGLPAAGQFLEKHLFVLMETLENDSNLADFKSKLQEITQKQKKGAPVYKIISETGPDHDKIFLVAVFAKGTQLGTGSGKSKQEAEQDAARVALDVIHLDTPSPVK